jgi:small subunit ribosomal protein S1
MAPEKQAEQAVTSTEAKADLSSLSSMLTARWKGSIASGGSTSKPEAASAGQIRSFRIARLDATAKKIELELASK